MSALLLALLCLAGAWPAFSQTSPIYAWTNFVGQPGGRGNVDGTGSAARFGGVCGMALNSTGNLFVAELNGTIRRVTPAGVVTTLAGSAGQPGSVDAVGSAARFYWPWDVAADSAGDLIVADTSNNTIRKVTPAGVVTTLAGSARVSGGVDGPGSEARFNSPRGVAVDSAGNVFVAERGSSTIRKATPAGVVTTLAGSAGATGTNDGPGSAARFNHPCGVAVDRAGSVFVADTDNCTIRKVTPDGVVTTLAGKAGPYYGPADGTGSAACFNHPQGLAVDSAGNVFVADTGHYTVRRVTPAGVVTTIGGVAGVMDGRDGVGSSAKFAAPSGIAVDKAGRLYVADTANNRITIGSPVYR